MSLFLANSTAEPTKKAVPALYHAGSLWFLELMANSPRFVGVPMGPILHRQARAQTLINCRRSSAKLCRHYICSTQMSVSQDQALLDRREVPKS